MFGKRLGFALVAILLASGAVAPLVGAEHADYERLTEWRFAAASATVSAPVSWTKDTADWRLESGRIWAQEATVDGTVTGFVFEGQGHFRMDVPDAYELAQLRRFCGREDLERLEYSFTKLVVRGSDLAGVELALEPPGTVEPHPLAKDRHETWLGQYREDADASVLAALANPGAEYLRIDMLTDQDDWMTYSYDSERLEEIELQTARSEGVGTIIESWISLDRPEDRLTNGRPSYRGDGPFDLVHVSIEAEIGALGKGSGGARGRTKTHMRKTDFRTSLQLEARTGGLEAVRLFLHPYAAVESVFDGQERDLVFVRDHTGSRDGARDNRLYNPYLTVFLPEPTVEGEALGLSFVYELEISNFVSGTSWYPTPQRAGSGLVDFHTARIAVTAPDNYEIRAMGEREDEQTNGKQKTTVYRVERPAKMVSFTTAERAIEQRLELEGLPEVVVFSSGRGMYEDMLYDTGADLANSINFFQKLLASELPIARLQATMIAAGHGQAFDGLLHLSDFTGVKSSATVPFFRAHEVAHQWWGHLVGWKSYRDQWLSEGFAEYSAMLYMAAALDNGDKLFQEALEASSDELTGSLKSTFSRFSRPSQNLLNKRGAERIGPIGHGWRANVADSPGAYFSLAYNKGAYVLHMLRTVMKGLSKSDDTFFAILQDFVATFHGKPASTEDFKAIVVKNAPGDWDWFFDQWVYRAAVPTYAWDYEIGGKNSDGKHEVTLRVKQSEVPPGFKMLVPLRVDFGGGKGGEMLVMIDKPEKTLTVPLPERPKKVVFNPDHAVLARMKKL